MTDVNNVPILITTAISPPPSMPFLEMTSPDLRAINSKAAVLMWASYGARKLVLVDSTGAEILHDTDLLQLAACGIEVEQLSYNQDGAAIVARGKGYGEGQIVKYAIDNSQLIAKEKSFFKSTGKTFVKNYNDIKNVISQNSLKRLFWNRIIDDYASDDVNLVFSAHGQLDARFYFCDADYARNYLIPSYENSDDRIGLICETLLHQQVSSSSQAVRCKRPIVSGFCGGSGREYYDGTLGAFDGSAAAWVAF